MKKWTEVIRLITAVLMGAAAGLDVAKKIRELAEQERAGQSPTLPDLGEALASANARIQEVLRKAAERAGVHNDMPGTD